MNTPLKSPDRLKDAQCEKGQLLIGRPFRMYLWLTQSRPRKNLIISWSSFKTRHTSVCPSTPLGNNKEYLPQVVAVLCIIKQKGLPKKCRMLAKAVVRWSEALKNLQEAAGSQETVSVDVTARKVEIEQTQQMLQEAQKAYDKAIAKSFKQLRNLLSGDA